MGWNKIFDRMKQLIWRNYLSNSDEQGRRRSKSWDCKYKISEAQHSSEIQSEYIPIQCLSIDTQWLPTSFHHTNKTKENKFKNPLTIYTFFKHENVPELYRHTQIWF